MSFKNSMVRGLALCGMNSVARAGYADSKMFSDIIAGTDKDARRTAADDSRSDNR